MKNFFMAVLFLLLGHSSHAEIAAISSLEWLANHSIASGIYRVNDIKVITFENSEKKLFKLSLELKNGYRGLEPPRVNIDYHWCYPEDLEDSILVEKNNEFLVCFQHLENGNLRVRQTINLDHPQLRGTRYMAVTHEHFVLKKRQEILTCFTDNLNSDASWKPRKVNYTSKQEWVEIPWRTELHDGVCSGSICYLIVPKNLKDASAKAAKEREWENCPLSQAMERMDSKKSD